MFSDAGLAVFLFCSLSDNNLKDEGIKLMGDIFARLPKLVSVM